MEEINTKPLLISLVAAIVVYAVHYYFMFGQWCSAMWAGTYPPVFILIATSLFYKSFITVGRIMLLKREKESRLDREYDAYIKSQNKRR